MVVYMRALLQLPACCHRACGGIVSRIWRSTPGGGAKLKPPASVWSGLQLMSDIKFPTVDLGQSTHVLQG